MRMSSLAVLFCGLIATTGCSESESTEYKAGKEIGARLQEMINSFDAAGAEETVEEIQRHKQNLVDAGKEDEEQEYIRGIEDGIKEAGEVRVEMDEVTPAEPESSASQPRSNMEVVPNSGTSD